MWGPDGRRWHFESGSLALDFGYTGDYGYGRPDWERLHTPEDLGDWISSRFDAIDTPVSDSQFAAAIDVRRAITVLAHSAADAQRFQTPSVDLLNQTASATPVRPYLPGGSTLRPTPTMTAVLSTIAANAIDILITPGQRVRRCAGENCQLIFFDHSRPNARRWCSMARCGNRAKARVHRATYERYTDDTDSSEP